MKVIGVIPARYGSTRFPGKPLALINGKPMVQRVYEQVIKSKELDKVVVATDHEDIKKVVEEFGGNVVMTKTDHETGSDRMAEVTTKVDGDFYVNIQGDEPLIRPELIDALVQAAKETPDTVVTAKTVLQNAEDAENPNVVKVVTDKNGLALYFSRSPIPYNRSGKEVTYYKHLGIYGYPKEIINEFVQLPASTLESLEVLEQLRLLENGYHIKVVETAYDAVGVDTPEDIGKVEKILGGVKHV
ncbi:3-deoxy-manno-octulosonate cytidylyltransferase [Bacillus taeanensis]|uniref:3-deoxy-manno-octulosonate cytidylyltransferase n=1 Tax=Bacillus taeanensis TaxID=273032 RepID=A0A366XTN5_9BACI|nr:3-deoxy-manno-octulosonate cytidylyltransferase [Bacillus taeanensis]RBW68908.1 3-deoxy-manno-octulosonate cytidylyltransferase [Bacillus taeanensis]